MSISPLLNLAMRMSATVKFCPAHFSQAKFDNVHFSPGFLLVIHMTASVKSSDVIVTFVYDQLRLSAYINSTNDLMNLFALLKIVSAHVSSGWNLQGVYYQQSIWIVSSLF